MLILRNLYAFYNHWFTENLGECKCSFAESCVRIQNFGTDPRTKDLPFLGSPLAVIITLTVYLGFVRGRGQEWMKNRKAFDLTRIMNVYNVLQVLANLYVFLRVSGCQHSKCT